MLGYHLVLVTLHCNLHLLLIMAIRNGDTKISHFSVVVILFPPISFIMVTLLALPCFLPQRHTWGCTQGI